MISYAPLIDEEINYRVVQKADAVPIKEQSECNTLVMIFIGSVLFLAMMDTLGK